MNGHAQYITEFLCTVDDLSLLQSLANDLRNVQDATMIKWFVCGNKRQCTHARQIVNGDFLRSRHQKFEDPKFSVTFNKIVAQLAQYFDLDVFATRLNFYRDNSSWKPFHKDSHAYAQGLGKEDFTVGVSLGETRALVFRHPSSGAQFEFPQVSERNEMADG